MGLLNSPGLLSPPSEFILLSGARSIPGGPKREQESDRRQQTAELTLASAPPHRRGQLHGGPGWGGVLGGGVLGGGSGWVGGASPWTGLHGCWAWSRIKASLSGPRRRSTQADPGNRALTACSHLLQQSNKDERAGGGRGEDRGGRRQRLRFRLKGQSPPVIIFQTESLGGGGVFGGGVERGRGGVLHHSRLAPLPLSSPLGGGGAAVT